jgi:SAM-dependent methyltransferase
MKAAHHWNSVYGSKAPNEVSWYQADPTLSLRLIADVCPANGRVIDVGGGASVLVDRLVQSGYQRPAVLDVSELALERAKARLGQHAPQVEWIVADVTSAPEIGQFDVWHDRAVFHFLTDEEDRKRYVSLAVRSLRPDGHLILATFAPDGPTRCSGLEVRRYDGQAALRELVPSFALIREYREVHTTPAGTQQSFFYGLFRRT